MVLWWSTWVCGGLCGSVLIYVGQTFIFIRIQFKFFSFCESSMQLILIMFYFNVILNLPNIIVCKAEFSTSLFSFFLSQMFISYFLLCDIKVNDVLRPEHRK